MSISNVCFFLSLYFHLLVVFFTCVSSQGDRYLLSTNGAAQIWGHAYVKRNQTGLATTATRPRSWVDNAFSLPVGRVVRFYAYVNRIASNSTYNSSSTIRFQIWYAVNTTQYRLLYEKAADTNNTEGVMQVDVSSDNFYTVSYCRLGWTSDNSIIPISFDFVDQYPLYYRTVTNVATDFPTTGQLYTNFNPNPYPAVFSVAVEIDPRLVGATGATGPPGGSSGNGTGNGSGMGATGATGLPGPPGPPGPPGYGAGGQYGGGGGGGGIDYTRCANVTSPTGPSDCAQVRCNDTNTTSSCRCLPGYQLGADGRSCTDVDECQYANGGCAINCTNTVGSFYCGCPVGLVLAPNKEDCLDVNECLNITCNQVCVNTFGSYDCLRIVDALKPSQGQKLESSDSRDIGGTPLNNNVATTGVLVWMAILTMFLLLLAVGFFYVWRKKQTAPFTSLPSAESIDGQSMVDNSSTGFAEFSNWRFGSVGERPTKNRPFHCATILSLGENNPAIEDNSKL